MTKKSPVDVEKVTLVTANENRDVDGTPAARVVGDKFVGADSGMEVRSTYWRGPIFSVKV